jgi:CDGSH-type Zn-finger protein
MMYRVEGEVEVLDADWRLLPARELPIHMCRCGRSASKRVCGGSHARNGSKDE